MTTKSIRLSDPFINHLYSLKSKVAKHIYNFNIVTEAKIDFLSYEVVDGKLMFSYLPDGREAYHKWTSNLRQTSRPVAVLTKLLGDKFKKEEYEEFVAEFKNVVIPPDGKIEVIEGTGILDAYHQRNYLTRDGTSTLEKSCLRYETHQNLLNTYLANSDAVKLVKVDVGGKVGARALLWTAFLDDRQVSVLDRKYFFNTTYEALLESWAKENVDFIRIHSKKTFLDTKTGEENYQRMLVKFNVPDLTVTPYVDTFKWYDSKAKTLCNVYDGRQETFNLANLGYGVRYNQYTNDPECVHACITSKLLEGTKVITPLKDCELYQDFWIPKGTIAKCAECKKQLFNSSMSKIGEEYYCMTHAKVTVDGKLVKICHRHKVVGDCDTCINYKGCGYCGDSVHKDTLTVVSSSYVCAACVTANCTNCTKCNGLILRGYETILKTGESLCTLCYHDTAGSCYFCGHYFLNADRTEGMYSGTRIKACYECYDHYACCECNQLTARPVTVEGETYCQNCLLIHTVPCNTCRTRFELESIENGACYDCREATGALAATGPF